ncbi:hypothetical protein [Marinactinospora rubrisoli]|uniref:Uncharacterized protein n=1 Tax=Marinactinospora rubrisoli TaxID=2715399 RepID=A0ABW2KHV4_9ACTN
MSDIHLPKPIMNVVDKAKAEVEKKAASIGKKVKAKAVSGNKVKGKYKSVDDVFKEFRDEMEKEFIKSFKNQWKRFHPLGEDPNKPPLRMVVGEKVRFSAEQLDEFKKREGLGQGRQKRGVIGALGKKRREQMEAQKAEVAAWLTPQQYQRAERERQLREGPSGNLSSGTYRGRRGMEQAKRQARHYRGI